MTPAPEAVFEARGLAKVYRVGEVEVHALRDVDLDLFRDHLNAGRLVQPYATTLNDGFGYYLVTDPEALSDTATAMFRSWLIDQFTLFLSAAFGGRL